MRFDYISIFAGWLFFGLFHSLTASNWLKRLLMKSTGVGQRVYRLMYNGLAIITFLPVLKALKTAPVQYLSDWHGSTPVSIAFITSGFVVIFFAFKQYGLAEFIGWPLRQAGETEKFRQDGILQYVRHPLYTATILIIIGLTVFQPDWKHLYFSLSACLYLRIGIYFEERKLIRLFGDQYRLYRKQVPMVIPSF